MRKQTGFVSLFCVWLFIEINSDRNQKLILLADESELGWRFVSEYQSNPLASDSEEEKRMYRAEARANKKLKAEKSKKLRGARNWPYRKPVVAQNNATQGMSMRQPMRRPGLCFACGKPGHWKGAAECPASSSNNKISSFMFGTPLSIKWVVPIPSEKGIVLKHVNTEIDLKDPIIEIDTGSSPVSRLKAHVAKWQEATDSKYILVNPLTVAFNKKGKPRFVLDCRYINPHLHQFKVKFEDIKVAETLFEKNSFLFTFDIKGAYHHIDIFMEHRKYLGFSYQDNSKQCYYVFNSLPFGIKTAGHIFTKLLRVVVALLRSKGLKIVMFLDDGIGGNVVYERALCASEFTRNTLVDLGFLFAEDKCNWIPSQRVEWLGHVLDMHTNRLFITENRVARLENSIDSMIYQIHQTREKTVPVRFVASIVGQIISLQSVVGNKVRLLTRHLFNCINTRASWRAPIIVTEQAISELTFWKENARKLNSSGKYFKHNQVCLFKGAVH